MAKVKPYIITIKYAAFYEDPRPTVEQILNELNIDALDIAIEDAVVTAKPSAQPYPVEVVTVKSAPAAIPVEDPQPFTKAEAPFDTFNLDSEGPSIKILSALYGCRKGRRASEIREITGLGMANVACTITRLKKQGRIKATGKAYDGAAIYQFVK